MRFPKKVVPILLASLLLAGLFALHAQQQTAEMKVDHETGVTAGESVTFTVTLDRAPSVEGTTVSLNASPLQPDPSGASASGGAGPSNPERTVYRFAVRIPVTASTSVWHVTNVSLGIPAAPNKPLKFKDVQFKVRERKDIVLPDSAQIEIGK